MHLSNMSAHQGRPPAAGGLDVSSPGPNVSRWVHQARLPRAAHRLRDDDLLQVRTDVLTGRVWLVPTFKTNTAWTAARDFVPLEFC